MAAGRAGDRGPTIRFSICAFGDRRRMLDDLSGPFAAEAIPAPGCERSHGSVLVTLPCAVTHDLSASRSHLWLAGITAKCQGSADTSRLLRAVIRFMKQCNHRREQSNRRLVRRTIAGQWQ